MKHPVRYLIIAFTVALLLSGHLAYSSAATMQQRAESLQSQYKPSGTGDQKKAPAHLESIAVKLIAGKYNKNAEDLFVYGSTVMNLPTTQVKAYGYTITQKDYGWTKEITIDENGKELDPEQLLADEIAAHDKKYGKLNQALIDRLAAASPDEIVSVIITIKLPPHTADIPVEPEMDSQRWNNMMAEERQAHRKLEEEYETKNKAYHLKRTQQAIAPVLDRLQSLGYDVKEVEGIPMLTVKLPIGFIKTVESWSEVWKISLDEALQPRLNTSRPTIGADRVEFRIGRDVRCVRCVPFFL
ncbi:MAG TPA: hypothetical protein VNI77_05695 [Nitrososphaera sp.]|nr:hypothetical protein [Nitrososphaera sp.]